MADSKFISILPEELEAFIKERNVKEYLLIDVRQPGEYEEGHLPGAKLIPIMQLVANLYQLPNGRDLVFYCRNDGRSMAAATLVLEENITHNKVYHLSGGIIAYNGKLQRDQPQLRIFPAGTGLAEQLKIAMDLEKGALKFYRYLSRRFKAERCAQTFAKLSQAEWDHAKSIYEVLKPLNNEKATFENCFDRLAGDILEGGDDLLQLQNKAATIKQNACVSLIELALEIEYSAFDLYRNIAENQEDAKTRELFWNLAQAEKKHIQKLSQAIE